MSDILTREEFQLACACGEDDDVICIDRHDLAQRAEIAALQEALAKIEPILVAADANRFISEPHSDNWKACVICNSGEFKNDPEEIYDPHSPDCPLNAIRSIRGILSTLSDAVERGKKLLGMEAENGRLRKALEKHHKWHLEVGAMYVSDDGRRIAIGVRQIQFRGLYEETIAALSGSRPSGEGEKAE